MQQFVCHCTGRRGNMTCKWNSAVSFSYRQHDVTMPGALEYSSGSCLVDFVTIYCSRVSRLMKNLCRQNKFHHCGRCETVTKRKRKMCDCGIRTASKQLTDERNLHYLRSPYKTTWEDHCRAESFLNEPLKYAIKKLLTDLFPMLWFLHRLLENLRSWKVKHGNSCIVWAAPALSVKGCQPFQS